MNKVNLLNKRILYLGPVYFHYDKYLIKKIRQSGGLVTPFELNLHSSYQFKYFNKYRPSKVEIFKEKYYNGAFSKRNYDYIIVRQGNQVSPSFFEKLRVINPNAQFINFHWDSIKAEYDYQPIIKYFDNVYSFDYKDCQHIKELKYLPLFYIDEYSNLIKKNHNIKFDILFIGSWRNMERLNLINLTKTVCDDKKLKFYYYLYFSKKMQNQSIKNGIIPVDAKSKSLSHKTIIKLFSMSNAVIDFPSSFQTGLTMRTFEALGAGKKLITTNNNILNEPFYDSEYINVIDIDNFELNINFLKNKPSTSIDEKMKSYTINSYINKLFQ